MEFLKIVKRRRSVLNEIVYIALNVALAIALMIVVRTTGSLTPALVLVILSKWRVFAVRPRFWFANIQANSICFIVSVSYVIFLYSANLSSISETQILIYQILLTVLYIAWLIFLKPQSKRIYIVAQAAVALFVGITAIYILSYSWIATPVVLLTWIVGYANARQLLNSYDEESHVILLSLAWAFVIAEIGWLAYHWTIAYPIGSNILLPQVSIITSTLAFLSYKAYDSYYHHQKVRLNDIVLPLVFTVFLIGFLVLFRNTINAGII